MKGLSFSPDAKECLKYVTVADLFKCVLTGCCATLVDALQTNDVPTHAVNVAACFTAEIVAKAKAEKVLIGEESYRSGR